MKLSGNEQKDKNKTFQLLRIQPFPNMVTCVLKVIPFLMNSLYEKYSHFYLALK